MRLSEIVHRGFLFQQVWHDKDPSLLKVSDYVPHSILQANLTVFKLHVSATRLGFLLVEALNRVRYLRALL